MTWWPLYGRFTTPPDAASSSAVNRAHEPQRLDLPATFRRLTGLGAWER